MAKLIDNEKSKERERERSEINSKKRILKILLQNKWRTEKQKNKRLWSLQWLFVTVDQHQKFEFEQGMFIAWKLAPFTAINYTDL
jgi:hypothetical protein